MSYGDSAVFVVRHQLLTLRTLERPHFQSDNLKLGQNVCLDEMSDKFETKVGHVGSETRSLGQILEKPCVRYRGHIFSTIIIKLGQNICLDEISDEFENGSCGLKNWATRLNVRKTLYTR